MSLPEAILRALHQRLAEKSGLTLTRVSDAFRLSEQMAKKKIYLSPYTIARLFGLLKDKRKPYTSSLDALARFLDFSDWFHLKCHLEGTENDTVKLHENLCLQNLHLALSTEKKRELYEALEALDGQSFSEAFVGEVGKVVGLYVRQYAQHRKKLLQWLATHPSGRFYFYENFVDEDNPGDYFRQAILEFYLPRSTKINQRIFAQAFAFTRALYDTGKAHFPTSFKERYFNYRFSRKLHPQVLGRLWEVFFIYHLERLKDYDINKHLESAALLIQELQDKERCLVAARITRAFAFHKKAAMLQRHSDWKILMADYAESGRYCGNIFEGIALFPFLLREACFKELKEKILRCDHEPFYASEYKAEMMVRALYQATFCNMTEHKNDSILKRLEVLVWINREIWLRGFLALSI